VFLVIQSFDNQYCRSYLETALCVIFYPPCNVTEDNVTVQGLCPDECTALLNTTECMDETLAFNAIDCNGSTLRSEASNFDVPLHYDKSCFSILENADPPDT